MFLEDLITIVNTDKQSCTIPYVDYVSDNTPVGPNSLQATAIKIFTKDVLLNKSIERNNIFKELTLKIKETAKLNENPNFIEDITVYDLKKDIRPLVSNILKSSNFIQVNVRYGPADIVLHNNDWIMYYINNHNPINLKFIRNPYLSHEDVIVYRKNNSQESGLLFITDNVYYEIIDIGFSFEKNFVYFKITDIIRDRKRKLSKI